MFFSLQKKKGPVGLFSNSDANTVEIWEHDQSEAIRRGLLEDHSRICKQLGCNPLKTGAINFGHLEGDTPQPPGIGGF